MAPRKQRNNGKRYSDIEKMAACQIVRSAGGTLTDELLKQIQLVLKIPTLSWDTVQRWYNASVEKPRTLAVSDDSRVQRVVLVETSELDFEKSTTRDIIEHTFRQYATQANLHSQVAKTDGKDAAAVMTSMVKLLQLVDGLPTEIIGAASELTELANFFRESGIEMSSAIREWRERLQARKAATKDEQTGVSNG